MSGRRVMQVTAICRRDACAVLDTGEIVHFATMLDIDGNETDDPAECAVAVAPLPDGNWVVIDFSEFETVAVH
jgi:hypothetical protein